MLRYEMTNDFLWNFLLWYEISLLWYEILMLCYELSMLWCTLLKICLNWLYVVQFVDGRLIYNQLAQNLLKIQKRWIAQSTFYISFVPWLSFWGETSKISQSSFCNSEFCKVVISSVLYVNCPGMRQSTLWRENQILRDFIKGRLNRWYPVEKGRKRLGFPFLTFGWPHKGIIF